MSTHKRNTQNTRDCYYDWFIDFESAEHKQKLIAYFFFFFVIIIFGLKSFIRDFF